MNRAILLGTVLMLGACASVPSDEPSSRQIRDVTRVELFEAGTFHLETTREESAVTTRLAASPERTWAALLDVYGELGIKADQLTVLDTRQHQMGIRGVTLRRIGNQRLSRWLDCGQDMSGPKADQYEVQVTLLSQVQPGSDGGSVVHSYLAASAKDRGVSSNPVPCSSPGTLEREIGKRVQLRALAANPS